MLVKRYYEIDVQGYFFLKDQSTWCH